jgi:uncharacterized protein (DUF488 family)
VSTFKQGGRVFTVGHSNHPFEHFLGLLRRHGITALADVRSTPYSRTNPQFNRDDLSEALKAAGIAYVFLGKELGARSEDPACYENGKVRYDRLAGTDLFRNGIERIREGSGKFRLVLMCAEREPLDCHRTILVAKHLADEGVDVEHIHADGRMESHDEALTRLLRLLKMPQEDMFHSREEILENAYRRQEERIAYTRTAATGPADAASRPSLA